MRASFAVLVILAFTQVSPIPALFSSLKFWKVCPLFFFCVDFHLFRASSPTPTASSASDPEYVGSDSAPISYSLKVISEKDEKTETESTKLVQRRSGVGGLLSLKKVQTSEIMGSIQLGIQRAIGDSDSRAGRELFHDDFSASDTNVFKLGSPNPPHQYSEFTFVTYAPVAFNFFRTMYGIQTHDFLVSFCSAPLRELGNSGASGSLFYVTQDDEFIMKTVEQKEAKFLKRLLRGFHEMYHKRELSTLLPKFFGLYYYQFSTQNMRLVAMNNLLPSSVKIHEKYDLKGSTFQRQASPAELTKKLPTFKDLDFKDRHKKGLLLDADVYDVLVNTIQRDSHFLATYNIMDYSLLLGIHNVDQAFREKELRNSASARSKASSGNVDESDDQPATALPESSSEVFLTSTATSVANESTPAETDFNADLHDLPSGGIPAFNRKGDRLLLFLGIIDILQYYRFRKRVEHTIKAILHEADTISVHEPKFYASRFLNFMKEAVFRRMAKPQSPGSQPTSNQDTS